MHGCKCQVWAGLKKDGPICSLALLFWLWITDGLPMSNIIKIKWVGSGSGGLRLVIKMAGKEIGFG